MRSLPTPADFAPPPGPDDLSRWADGDRDARPSRLARLRARLQAEEVDAYFGISRENSRYLTGFELAEGEEKSAGDSGRFLVTGDELVVLADSRYTIAAARQCPSARVLAMAAPLADVWPGLVGSAGVRRVAVEAQLFHGTWLKLASAVPGVELVPVEGWVEEQRATKEPAEIERIAAACAVADRALAAILPFLRPGRTEREVALELEWEMRTGGAEALAFDVTVLAAAEAALPHGAPGDRPLLEGAVVLFDFGAQVAGYRSDMTRTLFVGAPTTRDLAVYELVARAQAAAIDAVSTAAAEGSRPTGPAIDAVARSIVVDAGRGDNFGHSLGHGIGLATHEQPWLSRRSESAGPLPSPTVFSVEPGVYLEGEVGVRIEDLVVFDAAARRCERLTLFPRDVLEVGTGS